MRSEYCSLGNPITATSVRFKAEQIIGITVPPEIKREKFKIAKWPVAASLLLIGILTATFFLPNKGETVLTDSSDYEVRYKEERDRHQGRLGLTKDRFGKLNYFQEADREMAFFMANRLNGSPEIAETEFEEIIESLQTPSEMLVNVPLSNTLMDDEGESIAFLISYQKKVMDLISIYNEILWDYRNEIEKFEVESYLNKADRLMDSADEFPDELRDILYTMKDQSIQLVENRNTGEIRANYFMSDMYKHTQWNFHPNTYGYTHLFATGPLVVNGVLSYPVQESFYSILVMEGTLGKVTKDEVLYPALEAEYLSFFHQMIKGSSSEEVFDERGFVKEEYRDAWK